MLIAVISLRIKRVKHEAVRNVIETIETEEDLVTKTNAMTEDSLEDYSAKKALELYESLGNSLNKDGFEEKKVIFFEYLNKAEYNIKVQVWESEAFKKKAAANVSLALSNIYKALSRCPGTPLKQELIEFIEIYIDRAPISLCYYLFIPSSNVKEELFELVTPVRMDKEEETIVTTWIEPKETESVKKDGPYEITVKTRWAVAIQQTVAKKFVNFLVNENDYRLTVLEVLDYYVVNHYPNELEEWNELITQYCKHCIIMKSALVNEKEAQKKSEDWNKFKKKYSKSIKVYRDML